MQIPFLHQQLILETEKLRDMHRSLMMHQAAIPAVEMEAFLQQLRKLYEVALQLGNENALQLLNEVYYASEQKHKLQSAEIAEKLNHSPASPAMDARVQNDQSGSQLTVPATDHQPVAAVTKPAVTSSPVQQNEPAVKQTPSFNPNNTPSANAQTVAKKFTGHSTIGGKIAAADHNKRLSDNIKLPVSDINAAIGINEKFQFINQLFHGDSQKYAQFVSELNNCPSADIAKKSIQQIADENHWDGIPVAKHFMEVVERRFA